MLHLIFQSPVDTILLERIDPGDVAVFLENSVLLILKNSLTAGILTPLLSKNRFCALSDDLKIRGIAADELVKGIEVIDYPELVNLTVNNPIIQSWSQ